MVTNEFACFKQSLMQVFKDEIEQEFFNKTLDVCCECLGFDKKERAVKNPMIIQYIIQEARKKGKSSPTLESVISKILSNL
jgi:hypothetical protein